MITPVTNKSIIRLPQKALPALREVSEITSSPVGKDRLGPCLTALFKKQGIEPKDIRLDKAAGIRLMGMLPPLETRAGNEAIEQIFSGLELSVFLAQDQTLYILGDKGNLELLKEDKKESQKPSPGPISTANVSTEPQESRSDEYSEFDPPPWSSIWEDPADVATYRREQFEKKNRNGW